VRETKGDRVFYAVNMTIIILVLIIILYPLIYVLSCSVSSPSDVSVGNIWLWPKDLTVAGYIRVFQDPSIMTGYGNTLFYTVVGTAINLAVTLPAGFALSKPDMPGRRGLTLIFLFTMYFSGGMIPLFLLIKNLHMYDTRMVLLFLGAFSMWNCIICRTFFAQIPRDMLEAAEMDGASPFRIFMQVVLPVSQALVGVMVLFFAIGQWNSYFNAMMYTNSSSIMPLQLVLR